MPCRFHLPAFPTFLAALAILVLGGSATAGSARADGVSGLNKRACVVGSSISALSSFEDLQGRSVDCVLGYNDAAPDWANWERPWFLYHSTADLNWGTWAAAKPGRRLIITQNLFPSSVNNTDWRSAGARGDFADHARTLARNLIANGQDNAVIRLGHEANGDWYPDSVGNSPSDYRQWVQFWRATVQAMKSVPGAHFVFDWCINAGYRNIPLTSYYPGDDVVDVIGVDAYDSGNTAQPAGSARWDAISNRPGGLTQTIAFAKAHDKPLSIPEWGVAPTTVAQSGGDDPAYVNGIAKVIRDNNVAYQAYYYAHEFATQLANGSGSLAAYRRHFGAAGDSMGDSTVTNDGDADSAAPAGGSARSTAPAAAATTDVHLIPVLAPVTPAVATTPAAQPVPTAPATTLASVQSKTLAKALAVAVSARLRKVKRATSLKTTFRLTPRIGGTACVTVVARPVRATTLNCAGHIIRLSAGGRPRATTASTSKHGRPMAQGKIKSGRVRLHVSLARAGHRGQTIVSAFVPASNRSIIAVTSRSVRAH